jgi:DNA-3-methyladenine glycosylase II
MPTRNGTDRYREAVAHLTACHPALARVITRVGPCTLKPQRDLFDALVNTVISQQISVRAADTIAGRLEEACGGRLTPESILALSPKKLRGCGLSGGKQKSIRAIAQAVRSGELDLKQLRRADDEALAAALLPIHGLGPWSLQMIQIFALGRPNILPVGDLGLRMAVKVEFGLTEMPTPAAVEELARAWHPYCTVATWYLWRSRGFVPNSDVVRDGASNENATGKRR